MRNVQGACVVCGEPLEAGDYRLVGVEEGSWTSRYAHRGSCEGEARSRHAAAAAPVRRPRRKRTAPAVVELDFDEQPDPVEASELWRGLQRRR